MTAMWDETRAALARHARAMTAIAALAIVLPAIVSGITNLWQQEQPAGQGAVIAGLLSIAAIVALLWGQLALTALALADRGAAGAALRAGAARLPQMLAVVVLLMLAVVALTIPVALILAAAGVDLTQMAVPGARTGMTPQAGLAVTAYMLVLLPVALVIVARIALISPVVVAERRHVGAIARSWRLTRGLTFKLIGILLLYTVVALVLWGATRIVLGSLLLIAFGDGSPLNGATAALTVVTAIVSGGLSTVSTVFVARLYRAIVADGGDAVEAAAA